MSQITFKEQDLGEKGLNNIKKYRAVIMYLEGDSLHKINCS